MVIYLHTRITLLKIDSIRYFVSLFMKYKKSLAGYLFIGKMLLRHNKNALHLFIYNFYICIFLVFYNIYIFNFFIVSPDSIVSVIKNVIRDFCVLCKLFNHKNHRYQDDPWNLQVPWTIQLGNSYSQHVSHCST